MQFGSLAGVKVKGRRNGDRWGVSNMTALGAIKTFWQGPKTPDQAIAHARLASWALVVGAIASFARYWINLPTKAQMLDRMSDVRGPVTLEEAGVDLLLFEKVAEIMRWVGAGIMVVTVAGMIGLAVWQWKRPGWVIPLLFLVLTLAGVATVLSAMMQPTYRSALLDSGYQFSWVLNLILALVMIAAYRGGRIYHKLRDVKP